MKKYAYLFILLALVACDNQGKRAPEREIELSATIDNASPKLSAPALRKISGQVQENGNIDLVWSAGDALEVQCNGESREFTLIPGRGYEGGTFARFKGTIPGDKQELTVTYPYHKPDLSNQKYVEDGFDYSLLQMTGTAVASTDYAFTLTHTSSVFTFPLWSEHEETIKSVSLNVKNANKTYVVTPDDIVNVTLGKNEENSVNFSIVVDELDWSHGITLTVVDKNNSNRIAILSNSNAGTFDVGGIVTCRPGQLVFKYVTYPEIEMFTIENDYYYFSEVNAGANSADERGTPCTANNCSTTLAQSYNKDKHDNLWELPTKNHIKGMLESPSVNWNYESEHYRYVVSKGESTIYIPTDESGNCNLWVLDGENKVILTKVENKEAQYNDELDAYATGVIRPILKKTNTPPEQPNPTVPPF